MTFSDIRTQPAANREIYLDDEGIRLMLPDYFTESVLQFHAHERLFLRELLNSHFYKLVVEVGCSDYRLIGVKKIESDYLGVDINPPRTKRLISERGAIIRCEANRFFLNSRLNNAIVERYGKEILCILPFNFLGTMDAPTDFLDRVRRSPFDLVLSLFSTSDTATAARLEYYHLCGIDVQGVVRTDDYVRLDCSNGFQAFAFEPHFIEKQLSPFGFYLAESKRHDVCKLLYFTKVNPEPHLK